MNKNFVRDLCFLLIVNFIICYFLGLKIATIILLSVAIVLLVNSLIKRKEFFVQNFQIDNLLEIIKIYNFRDREKILWPTLKIEK
tara:strand:+ start:188 stop:442 length:255 start_codon:yes stop_codon:yes gene_type:complete